MNELQATKILSKLVESGLFSAEISTAINLLVMKPTSEGSGLSAQQPNQRGRSNTRWSKEEETRVVSAFLNGRTIDSIAIDQQRSCNAIFQRLLLTGLVTLDQPIQFRNSRPQQLEVTPVEKTSLVPTLQPGRICTKCGEIINPARLSAQPNTYRCIKCQRDFERRFGFGLTEGFN